MTRDSTVMEKLKIDNNQEFICSNPNYTIERSFQVVIIRGNELTNPIICLNWTISSDKFIGCASYTEINNIPACIIESHNLDCSLCDFLNYLLNCLYEEHYKLSYRKE